MTWPTRLQEIVMALYAGVNPQDDDARRIAIQRVGEQAAYDLGARWGNKKRAGLGDAFRSPDSIAYLEDDGSTSVWDIQASSGAILTVVGKPPDHPNLPPSDATFIPCQPIDHMGVGQPTPKPPTPDPTVITLLTQLSDSLKAITAEQTLLRALLADIHKRQDRVLAGGNRPFSTLKLRPE